MEQLDMNFDYESWMKFKEMWKRFDTIDSCFIASRVSELGFPRFTNEIPTAGVRISKVHGDVEFLFHKPFYHSLSTENLAFVFTHEMLHIAFGHIQRGWRQKIEDGPRFKLWNWAIDCIVNTWCEILGFGVQPNNMVPLEGQMVELKDVIVTPEKLGYPNFSHSTTAEQIYAWLLQKNEEEIKEFDQMLKDIDSHMQWGDSNGSGKSDPKMDQFAENVASALKKEFVKSGSKSLEKEFLERMKQKEEQDKNSKNPGKSNVFIKHAKIQYGNQECGEARHYYNLKDRVSTDVLQLIHKKIKSGYDNRPKETWMRRPRKLAGMSNVILPTEWDLEDKCKFLALLVIDSSGSITDDQISQDVRFARSFPLDKIDYTPIAFDTRYYELNKAEFYNRNGYPTIPGRGGTDISLPERYIKEVYLKKHGKRPDVVLILTDGDGSFSVPIAKKDQGNYVWILTKNNNEKKVREYCPGGIIFKTNIQ